MKILILAICALLVASASAKEPIKKKSGDKLLKGKRESPSGSYLPSSNAYLPPSKAYLPPSGSGSSNVGGRGAIETYIIASGIGGGFGGGRGFGSGGHSFGGGIGVPKFAFGGLGGLGSSSGGYSKLHTLALPSQSYGTPGGGYAGLSGHGGYFGGGQGISSGSLYGHEGSSGGGGYLGGHFLGNGIGSGHAGYGGNFLGSSFGGHTLGSSALGSHSLEGFGGGNSLGGGHSFGGALSFGGGHSLGGAGNEGHSFTIGGGDHLSSLGSLGGGHGVGIPSGSYGVPLAPPISTYTPQIQIESSHGGIGAAGISSGYETPSYAAGHKGLRHYQSSGSYRSAGDSKVLALESGYDLPASSGHSQAPFRPSVFLGATHEVSVPSHSYGGPSQEYGTPETSGHGGDYDVGAGGHGSSAGGSTLQASYLPPAVPKKTYLSQSSSAYDNSPASSSNYGAPIYSTINYSSVSPHGHH